MGQLPRSSAKADTTPLIQIVISVSRLCGERIKSHARELLGHSFFRTGGYPRCCGQMPLLWTDASLRHQEMISMTSSLRTGGATVRTAVQQASFVVGVVFLVVGVAGFIPGITTHYGDMTFAGHDSMAKLLGVFMVSVLHNIVHLLFGIAGIALSRTAPSARNFLIGGGVIYLVLWIYGLVIDQTSSANFVPINTADNWLHFLLGAGMIALGVVLSRRRADVPRI
jgi:Domain of unknown function (DUF4383)